MDLGELMLSLCYLPTAGRLTVTIIKARNLKAMDITGTSGKYYHRDHKLACLFLGAVSTDTVKPLYFEAPIAAILISLYFILVTNWIHRDKIRLKFLLFLPIFEVPGNFD